MGRLVITAFLAWLGLAAAVAACGAMPVEAERLAVPAEGPDAGLLDAALRAEVNRQRCARDLAPLDAAPPLRRHVAAHSHWMAETGQLSHDGRRGLDGRLAASGISYRRGAENIGRVQRYRIDDGVFRVVDAQGCHFAREGRRLPVHSYASLARRAVAVWMASPGHRRNILDPRMRRVAGAAAVQPDRHCGRVWLTQTFAG